MVAIYALDGSTAAPTVTNRLARGELLPAGYGVRQFSAQIEIPTHALIVRAAKEKKRFGMRQVDRVFHFAAPDKASFVEVGDFYSQALQFAISLLKAG